MLISDMQQVHNERDRTLTQQSRGFANEAKKANAPAPSQGRKVVSPVNQAKAKKKKGRK